MVSLSNDLRLKHPAWPRVKRCDGLTHPASMSPCTPRILIKSQACICGALVWLPLIACDWFAAHGSLERCRMIARCECPCHTAPCKWEFFVADKPCNIPAPSAPCSQVQYMPQCQHEDPAAPPDASCFTLVRASLCRPPVKPQHPSGCFEAPAVWIKGWTHHSTPAWFSARWEMCRIAL